MISSSRQVHRELDKFQINKGAGDLVSIMKAQGFDRIRGCGHRTYIYQIGRRS